MTQIEDDVMNSQYHNKYEDIRKYAQELLGGVHHICTNDFSSSVGAIIWTDHGIGHSSRIIEYLDKLIHLNAVENENITSYDKFVLLSAVWLHDVGMFLRHPDIPDLYTQRIYHSRIARCFLRQIWPNSAMSIKNRIAEICELHQTKTKSMRHASSKINKKVNLLGNLLLLADALDVCKDRVSREAKVISRIVEEVAKIDEHSAAEWWVNNCVTKTSIEIENGDILKIDFNIDKDLLKEWKKRRDERPVSTEEEKTLFSHLKNYLYHYVKKYHWRKIKENRDFMAIRDIKINISPAIITPDKDIIDYKKIQEIWIDHLSDYQFTEIRNDLTTIRNTTPADAIYIFVFDKTTETIRYIANQTILEVNGENRDDYNKILHTMRRQKIPHKWGIIGYVSYCGLVEFIEDVDLDPRQCYREEDEILKLCSVMFFPLARDNKLWGIIMVNRKRGTTFRQDDLNNFKNVMEQKKENVIKALQKYAAPYE